MARCPPLGYRLANTLVVAACFAGACQSLSVDFGDRPERRSTLGEMAHGIALSNAEGAETCSPEYQALLISERDLMVSGIDESLTPDVVRDLPSLMRESVLPAFDQGELKALTDAVGDSLHLLVDDSVDPNREALNGLSDLLHTQAIIQDDHLLELARALTADPRLTSGLASFAGLSDTPERDGDALDSLLYATSRALAQAEESSNCVGLVDQFSAAHLLESDGFEDAIVPGNLVAVSRVDAQGVATGELYDAKGSAWAHLLRIGGEAVAAGVVTDLALVLDAALGEATPCAPADHPNCYQYASVGNPVYQFLFAGLEVARFPRPTEFLATWSQLVNDNPQVAEQVLVSVGALIETVGNSNLQTSGPELYGLVEEVLPLVSDIFQINTSGGQTMPRLLMDVVFDLSATSREFPDKLLVSIDHTQLNKVDECSDKAPDANSPKVDYTRRRFYFSGGTVVDNRSTLEQSIELLADAHCGTVPFTGGMSVGETIVDLMSRLAPDTVCNLIGDLLGLLGVTGSIGEAVVNTALAVVGCDSDDVRASDLFALDDLAKSGALDFYLPIAKTFREEGQLSALLDIFVLARNDLLADEDADANSSSALRPLLPVIAELLRADVMDPFFDLNDLLVTVDAEDGSGTLADVVIDSGARLLEDRGTINTATGAQSNRSLAQELVTATRGITERVDTAGRSEAASRIFDFASALVTETYVDDQGTADLSDDTTHLQDRSLVPLLSKVLQTATEASRLPPAEYQCYLQEWQGESGDWVSSPALAALVGVGVALDGYQERPALESMVAGLLEPERDDTNAPPYDEILRVSAEVLQNPVEISGLDAVTKYLSELLYPSVEGKILVTVLAHVLSNDSTSVLQRFISQGLGPSGSDAEQAPFYKLATLAEDYAGITVDSQCLATAALPDSPAALEVSVLSLVSALKDEDSVLAGVYDLLRKRSGP